MKYCIDCKWFKPASVKGYSQEQELEFGICSNPKNIIESGLSPELTNHVIKFAKIHREQTPYYYRDFFFRKRRLQSGYTLCGLAGDWWEPADEITTYGVPAT